MTPREYMALKRVWAGKESQFHNAHFNAANVPFIPDDFLFAGSRVARIAEEMRAKADVMMERSRLDMMKKGTDDGVPLMFREIGVVN